MTVTTPDSSGSVEALGPVLTYLRDLHQWLDWAPVAACPARDPVEGLKCSPSGPQRFSIEKQLTATSPTVICAIPAETGGRRALLMQDRISPEV